MPGSPAAPSMFAFYHVTGAPRPTGLVGVSAMRMDRRDLHARNFTRRTHALAVRSKKDASNIRTDRTIGARDQTGADSARSRRAVGSQLARALHHREFQRHINKGVSHGEGPYERRARFTTPTRRRRTAEPR